MFSGVEMKGLTSKEHLFLRVISLVTLINAVAFYNVSRYMQTFVANFFETVAFITALTLIALTVTLEFWWRYFRRTDNQRFWIWGPPFVFSHKPEYSTSSEPNYSLKNGRETKGLTSKEHLFLRVLSVVAVMDAVTFYVASRNLQTFIANFTEVITLITVLTLFVLVIHLEYWWRYLRRRDNLRFWKPQKPLTEEVS
jgi:membrane protein YdbS with pleckstrin-like domain